MSIEIIKNVCKFANAPFFDGGVFDKQIVDCNQIDGEVRMVQLKMSNMQYGLCNRDLNVWFVKLALPVTFYRASLI